MSLTIKPGRAILQVNKGYILINHPVQVIWLKSKGQMFSMRNQSRFTASKCDRCGKATPAKQNDIGDLFTLPEAFGAPLMDEGSFCESCCSRYSKEEWIGWFRINRPDVLEDFGKTLDRQDLEKALTRVRDELRQLPHSRIGARVGLEQLRDALKAALRKQNPQPLDAYAVILFLGRSR